MPDSTGAGISPWDSSIATIVRLLRELEIVDERAGKQVNYGRCVSGPRNPNRPCPPGHICVRYSENASYCIPVPVCDEGPP